jgi:phosphomannomutase
MSIFKAYDIRGIYGKELTDEKVENISKAFANLLHARKVVVGMDVRKSSPSLKDSVIKGLMSQGCHVIDIGLVPIPVLYYFIDEYKMKAGIFITGSHDALNYNGLKLCKSKAIDLTYETGISKLEKIYGKKYPNKRNGGFIRKKVSEEYENQLLKKFDIQKPMRVVVDAGNGCFSEIAPNVFERLDFRVTKLFCEFDGNFPNRPPEPLESNLKALKDKVREVNADFGVAFDADGDRAVFVDENGSYISPDIILMLFAKELLKKGDSFVATIACTKTLEDLAKRFGWRIFWTRVGRSYVKQKMFNAKAVLGGEISGHYFFKENSSYDDGLFAALILSRILDREAEPLSYLVGKLPTNPSIDLRLHCVEGKKKTVIKKIERKFRKYNLVLVDGVGIRFKNGFALLRPSNTEEKLELRIEANSEPDLFRIKREMESAIKSAMKS